MTLFNEKNHKITYFKLPYFNSFRSIDKYKKIFFGDKFKRNNFKNRRFGIMGLSQSKSFIYAAGYNYIYEICKKNFQLTKVISNKLMSDLHGILVMKNSIYYSLTGLDTIIESDLFGKVKNTYTFNKNLEITKNLLKFSKIDWRFYTKLIRGPTGYFHFNFIEKISNNQIQITSRNLNCAIIFNLKKLKGELIPFHLNDRIMIHDGKRRNNNIIFTSVNGKIIIAQKKFNKKIFLPRKKEEMKIGLSKLRKFHIGLQSEIIDLNRLIKREVSWCRGIEVLNKNKLLVLIDGNRYSYFNQCKVICYDRVKKKIDYKINILNSLSKITKDSLSVSTGFDIIKINDCNYSSQDKF